MAKKTNFKRHLRHIASIEVAQLFGNNTANQNYVYSKLMHLQKNNQQKEKPFSKLLIYVKFEMRLS